MKLRATLATTLLSAALLAGCGGGGGAAKAPATATVRIAGFKFAPATTTVQAGGSVRFVNADRAEHTATLADRFDTGAVRKGQTKAVVLRRPGTYAYHCDFHPYMTGEIVVK